MDLLAAISMGVMSSLISMWIWKKFMKRRKKPLKSFKIEEYCDKIKISGFTNEPTLLRNILSGFGYSINSISNPPIRVKTKKRKPVALRDGHCKSPP